MHIDLSRNSSVKLYLQITKTLADRIQSGLLPQGTKLPSIRHLSSLLAVSPVTVSKAYAELESMNLVTCTQGKGCYVAEASVPIYRERTQDLSWQMSLIDYLPRAQLWRNFNHSRKATYSFHIAAIQPELLPTREIIADTQRLSSEHSDVMAAYGTFEGDLKLREVFADHLSERGIPTVAEQLLVTSGAQQGIDLVARTFVGPGDVVYMEAPTYTGAIDVFTSRGAKVIMIPMDEQGMRIDILTRLCDTHPPKLIYTIPTFHNPTGVTLTVARRTQLLDLAQSYHCLIVEDDPFSDLYYKAKPPLSIKAHDQSGHVVYIKSFSKTVAPGCRIACVAATGSVMDRLVAAKSTTDLGSPLLTQKALLPFIRNRLDQHFVSLREQIRDRLTVALNTLQRYAPPEVAWYAPEGGLNLWIKLPSMVDIPELERVADREGISFLPGAVCYAGGMDSNHIRISFSYADKETLKSGLRKLCTLLGEILDHSVIVERKPIL
ncbi:PLP-dependent aminotransferase family protein [Paenibacillus polymyxa]|uniref:MocR-like pyridoxine biosynthesis transcription factor PdxR n=1 Tax=Paenibacillus polymyxa TaxID=1406 RepID=UPI000F881EC9|nr:PLP-dependent aminotransferase family protein [Paenibacillus polymyxa]QDA28508.1 PLP-dependent aminotransferase family protein [Paenibacillus polymyxa]RTZ31454.1 PLP-dependent aminotransferase family protein [Paenibacillus polymyxa]